MTTPRRRPEPQRFLLELRDAIPGDEEADPVAIRLRRALKCLLRSFGLRCDRAEVHPIPPSGSLPGALGKGESLGNE